MKLPLPLPEASKHSESLKAVIIDEIAQKGPISFQRFMQMALYQPVLGYYSAGAHKLGEAGDFITAPELSPLFSWCVARQCQQVLADMEHPIILELGAGTGIMALEILRELERLNTLPEKYYILEVSADLKQRQQQLFATEAHQFLPIISWLDQLPQQPINGVIVANEVMDAMPVHQFEIKSGIQERYVGYKNNNFYWTDDKANEVLKNAIEALDIEFTEGYRSEINLLLKPWIKSLSDTLDKGLILLIDYGYVRSEYFHPERHMGTLMCHYRHHAHDNPFIYPGIQDITAHVDFTAVAQAGHDAQLELSGFTHQAGFLVNCGLMEFVDAKLDITEGYIIAQQIKRLTLPGEMGERFKVIALSKQYEMPLIGFCQLDQSHRL